MFSRGDEAHTHRTASSAPWDYSGKFEIILRPTVSSKALLIWSLAENLQGKDESRRANVSPRKIAPCLLVEAITTIQTAGAVACGTQSRSVEATSLPVRLPTKSCWRHVNLWCVVEDSTSLKRVCAVSRLMITVFQVFRKPERKDHQNGEPKAGRM